ncbi:hypothetical protein AMST5_03906 [freshwater sediment metagenome]|uniref:Uncharacterized protein n=1 Tax=freshwater sediment metagenome TaxID=556182 RepID=A0AA48M2U1_9ZZZZ
MWVRDIVDLLWDTLRYRRLKAKLMQSAACEGLQKLLQMLDDDSTFRESRAYILAARWARRDPKAVTEVNDLLKQAGLDQEAIAAQTLAVKLDVFSQLERMIMQTEARRNAIFREVDRRREALARRLREATAAIDGEFTEIAPVRPGRRGMRPSARTRANRRNARASTGPRTPTGKARVAQNALRHGLAVPVSLDPHLADAMNELAPVIAGEGADAARLERARGASPRRKLIDVLRVRQARYALLADPEARRAPLDETKVFRDCMRSLRGRGALARLEAARALLLGWAGASAGRAAHARRGFRGLGVVT